MADLYSNHAVLLVVVSVCTGATLGMNFALGPPFIVSRFGTGDVGVLQSVVTSGIALIGMTVTGAFGVSPQDKDIS